MSTAAEIESAIRDLPEGEFWKLADWFDKARDEAWSRKMQADAAEGRLDFLFDEANADRIQGRNHEWPVRL